MVSASSASPTTTTTSSNSIATAFGINAGKLLFFLLILPSFVTFVHLRQRLYGTSSTAAITEWIYIGGNHAPGYYGRSSSQQQQRKGGGGGDNNYYKLLYSGSAASPLSRTLTVMDVASALTRAPQAQKGRPYLVPAQDRPDHIPCLYKADESMVCSNDMILMSSQNTTSLFSNRPSSRTRNQDDDDLYLFRHLLQLPATCLLLTLNIGLAIAYWNHHHSTNVGAVQQQVSKIYTSMMGPHTYEIWRAFTGTTAHFEIWHLGLNMMSLWGLGRELEGTIDPRRSPRILFSSMEFFLYNIALIPIVSCLWCALQQFLWIYYPNAPWVSRIADPSRPTVGYSGILFAWMVVASLEQSTTCPIVFLPQLCFSTHQWMGIKFNVAPLTQLIILQLLLPRVSFLGHLAGIVAGFLLHWGFLPLYLFQPAIVIPGLYFAYLKIIRKVIPSNVFSFDFLSSDRSSGMNDAVSLWHQRTVMLYRMQFLPMMFSISGLGLFSSLTLSYAATVLFSHCLCHVVSRSTDDSTVPVLAKAYTVSAVLVMITDAMTVGSWNALSVEATFPTIVILLRAGAMMLCLVSVQEYVPAETSGILEWTLGYTTLQPCRALMVHPWLTKVTSGTSSTHGAAVATSTSLGTSSDVESGTWRPFSGGGHRLGSA